jgi:hypothetical protein
MEEMNLNNGEEYENDSTLLLSNEVLLLRILAILPQYHFPNLSFFAYGSLSSLHFHTIKLYDWSLLEHCYMTNRLNTSPDKFPPSLQRFPSKLCAGESPYPSISNASIICVEVFNLRRNVYASKHTRPSRKGFFQTK